MSQPWDPCDLVDDMELEEFGERVDAEDEIEAREFIRAELRAIERDLRVPLLVEWVR